MFASFAKFSARFNCSVCHRGFRCECGYGVAFFVIAGIAAAAALASAGVAIYSGIQQSEQTAKTAKYNATVQENNAQMARDSAKLKAQAIANATERQTAEGVNLLAAGGVDTSSGSPLLYQLDQAAQSEIAQRQAIYAGEIQATGNLDAANAYRADAKFAQGNEVGKSLLTGLGGVSSAASGVAGAYRASPAPSGGYV
jgi:chorismate synthase